MKSRVVSLSVFFAIVLMYPVACVAADDTQESGFEPASVAVRLPDGEEWAIGDRVDEEHIAQENTVIETEEFGVPIGPYFGAVSGDLKIGWNNQNRLLYIEPLSSDIETLNGLRIGSSRPEVLDRLGHPTMQRDDRVLYAHNDAELLAMVFVFDSREKVTRMILFNET